MVSMRRWARWVFFAAACGGASTACGLDMQGLATAGDGWNEGGAGSEQQDVDGAGTQSSDAMPLDAMATPGPDAPQAGDGATQGDAVDDAIADAQQDAPADGSSACDQDGDGHLAMGGACSGDDCCDTDPDVHPGQGNFFTQPDHCGSFDYDCDGKLTEQYGQVNCNWQGFGCSGDGFAQAPPACGASATYDTCNLGFFTCNTSSDTRAQGCR